MTVSRTERLGGEALQLQGASVALTFTPRLVTAHIWAAEHFARLTREREAVLQGTGASVEYQHRAYAMAAVLESVAFLEALINERLDLTDPGDMKCSRGPVLDKFQHVLRRKRKAPFNRGQAPFQAAGVLVAIRNQITHYASEAMAPGEVMDLQRIAGRRFPLTTLAVGDGSPWFPHRCLGAGCATWSAATARAFADAFCDKLGQPWPYQGKPWVEQP